MSNNQPKTFCPLLQPLQSENKTHPLPSPGVKKVWIPSQMLDLQDVPKRGCIGAGGGGGVECHTPLAPAELRVAPSRLTLSRPRHTGKDPPLIKVTTDHYITYMRAHLNACSKMLWADILSDRKQYGISVNLKVMFFSNIPSLLFFKIDNLSKLEIKKLQLQSTINQC